MDDERVLADALNDCLDALEAKAALETRGSTVQDCLARYPQQAARLEELLQFSRHIKAAPIPAPTPQILAAGERRVVRAVQAQAAARRLAIPSVPARHDENRAVWKPRLRALWAPLAGLAGVVAVLLLVVTLVAGGNAYRAWRVAERASLPAPAAEAPRDPAGALPTTTPRSAVQPAATSAGNAAPAVAAETAPARAAYLPLAARPIPHTQALLANVRGLVQVQAEGGAWSPASESQLLDAGQRVRTGALSAADLAFYDGSVAQLGPQTELSLDRLAQNPGDLSRVVVLTQSLGQTDHHVAPALGTQGQYTVHTPSGSGTAVGTVFHVSVAPSQAATLAVDEGVVAVVQGPDTVRVVAGQQTTLRPNAPPSEPAFRVTGEGMVEQVGDTWLIAGQVFITDEHTAIAGDPRVGDWVRVQGRLLPNGDRLADRIVLWHRAEEQRFRFAGVVQERGDTAWTVAGQTIAISDTTAIDEPVAAGDRVRVEGIVLDGGTLLARSIHRLGPQGHPFGFVGVVQEIADSAWVVSGISLAVDDQTTIDPGLNVGDTVRVRGARAGEDGWRARSITRYQPQEQSFEFAGLVESMDPWIVSGVDLATDAWTEIDHDIAVGDPVKVEGRILSDGAWLAEEIKRVDEREGLPFEFSGRVESAGPWVVSGISLTVDGRTEIVGPIAVGDPVTVEGLILPSGAWLATEIRRVDAKLGLGCMQITSEVLERHGNQITLQNAVTLHIGGALIQGDIRVGSVVQVDLCIDKQGHITVISIVVIYEEPDVTPTATLSLSATPALTLTPTTAPTFSLTPTIAPQPTRVSDDQVCDCDDDGDNEEAGACDCEGRKVVICHKENKKPKTMSVPWPAWIGGHQQHGDTLGPCE